MSKIQAQKNELAGALLKMQPSQGFEQERIAHIQTYQKFTEGLSGQLDCTENAEAGRAIIQKLIHRIEVDPTGFTIHYFAGEDYLSREMQTGKESSGQENIFLKPGSTRLTNGGRHRARTCDLCRVKTLQHKNINH